jgi:hypothetical protein
VEAAGLIQEVLSRNLFLLGTPTMSRTTPPIATPNAAPPITSSDHGGRLPGSGG